jgi:hypothetical protein
MPDRYCRNCGHELRGDDRFCPNCGRSIHETARVPTPEADVPVPPPPQQAEESSAPPSQQTISPGGWGNMGSLLRHSSWSLRSSGFFLPT